IIELDDMLKTGADRRERIFQVDESLLGLSPKIADKPVVAVKPKLAGNVDQPPGSHRVDHMRISARLRNRRRIDKAMDRHWLLPDIRGLAFRRPASISEFGDHAA